jgi:hypothetical protein
MPRRFPGSQALPGNPLTAGSACENYERLEVALQFTRRSLGAVCSKAEPWNKSFGDASPHSNAPFSPHASFRIPAPSATSPTFQLRRACQILPASI